MRRLAGLAVFTLLFPAVLSAQSPAAPAGSDRVVAVVNGEEITRAALDAQWAALSEPLRAQYEQVGGGRAGFLETLVQKRVVLQKAVAAGYDKWPEITAKKPEEREKALFDLYVREVVAPRVVTDELIEEFYAENPEKFMAPEQTRVRIIAVSTAGRDEKAARELITRLAVQMFPLRARVAAGDTAALVDAFAANAASYSDHPSAEQGGDLGWIDVRQLDPKLGEVVRKLPENVVSGIVETESGFALLLVEKRNPARMISFEEAREPVRMHLLSIGGKEILAAAAEHARQLRAAADVKIVAANVN